jgi:hypothetical protein
MKKVAYLLLILSVVSIVGVIWFGNSKKSTPLREVQTTKLISLTKNSNSITSSSMEINTARDKTDTNSITAKYKNYLAGKINKAEMMEAVISGQNMQNQDYYGKVVDQYGNPVTDADVEGNIMLDSLETSKEETHITQTDNRGFFQFTGLHGASLGVHIRKEGYEMDARGKGSKAPIGQRSSQDDRATFTIWKFRGAEPIKYVSTESHVPFDGTPITFDITTGKENPNGDLRVTLLRVPLQVRRSGQKFDWGIKIEILHGGLIAENDAYPYWAPISGYQPYFEFNISSNDVPWHSTMTQNFYIKNSHGQFGRMQMDTFASATPSGVRFDVWINPSGSQNLEFDPVKQIQ